MLEAIENFDPALWHDVLLDGPERDRQIDDLKTLVRRLGRVGIPTLGYNFSIAGVWGHVEGPRALGPGPGAGPSRSASSVPTDPRKPPSPAATSGT